MEYTVSIHVSKDSNAINNLGNLKRADMHNNRKYNSADEKGYDKSKNIELITGGTYIERYMEAVNKRITPEVLWDYNQGKKRNRQIDNAEQYIKRLGDSRSQIAVEMVVQVGDRDMWREEQYSKNKDNMKQVYQDFLEYYKKDNPNIDIISASIHFDEESPHMHVIMIPFAERKENGIGLPVQISKNQVFTRTYLKELQINGRAELENSMKKHINPDFKLAEMNQGRNKDYHKNEYVKQITDYVSNTGIDKARENLKEFETAHKDFEKALDNWNPFNKKKHIMEKLEKLEPKGKQAYENTIKYGENIEKALKQIRNDHLEKEKAIYFKSDNELFKLMNRKQKKEIADLIREDYINTDEFKDFKNRVIEDYKTTTINKVQRLNTQKKILEELKIEKKELTAQKDSIKADILGLKQDIANIKIEKSYIEYDKNKLQKELTDFEEKTTQVKDEYNKAKQIMENPDIQKAIRKYNAYRLHNGIIIKQNNDLQQKNDKLKKEKEETEKQTKQRQQELDKLNQEIQSANAKITAINNNSLIEKYKKLMEQIKALEEEENKKRKTVLNIQKEIQDLEEKQQRFKDLSKEIQGLEDKRDTMAVKEKELEKSIEFLNDKFSKLETKNDVMIIEFNKFRENLYDILETIYPNDSNKVKEAYNKTLEYMADNPDDTNYNDMLKRWEEKIPNTNNRKYDYERDI